MDRWHVKYRFLEREQLHDELVELCRRLRRLPRPEGRRASSGGGASPAAVRCLLTKEHSDADLPWLIEAERRAYSLLGAVCDVAALLGRLNKLECGPGGRCRLPS